jgi:dipeptidyl aminopeptidase/acylaminoacyl peptidase
MVLLLTSGESRAQSFTMDRITGYPFISELKASMDGSEIALSVNEKGKRNIYVGRAPDFTLHRLTRYEEDDGREITSVTISPDGKWVVYVRGGDHGAFDETIPRNPSSSTQKPAIDLYSIPFSGGESTLLGQGDEPLIDPGSKRVLFIKNNQAWVIPVDGSAAASNVFYAKGRTGSCEWSPDGSRILFGSSRGDHALVGIYTDGRSSIQWIAPSFARDQDPHWSPDGNRIAFIRRPAGGGAPDSLTVHHPSEWAIWTADAGTGKARQVWKAPGTLRGSVPSSQGRYNLHWVAGDRIVFLSYQDGWPHMYSLPAGGGEPLLLTPGAFNVEQISVSPDKKWLLFATNSGQDKDDMDRRHIARVPVDQAGMQMLTSGTGIESTPVFINQGSSIAILSATAQRPTLPAIIALPSGKMKLVGENLIPENFPASSLVSPKSVEFTAADGQKVYGQMFEPKGGPARKPAILFIHGGPQRQMLLGWHYMDYYANTYALNQYLVSKGFIVLSVNYRLGIGYGYEFQHPEHSGMYGASEYRDVRAAGLWMASQPQIDAARIGVYGGSYGGFLAAMALGRDSKIFAAGVDLHGVHNFLDDLPDAKVEDFPDRELAKKLAWESSPVAYADEWTSPVLFIHGDDDGNVPFHQSVDMEERLREKGVSLESLVIPDETHHWLVYSNMVRVDAAVADFLERKLGMKPETSSLAGKTVCIDPGHGGTASTDHYRASPSGQREEWINLRVAQLLKTKLEEKGAKVIMTRTTDEFVALDKRAKEAVAGKADVFVSIHHNATADSSVNFPIIYFHGAASENGAGVKLGRILSHCMERYLYNKKTPESLNSDFTIFPSRGAGVLRNTYGIPGVLGEASFFTNPTEDKKLSQEEYNAREASAYVDALESFFATPVPEISQEQIPSMLRPFPVLEESDRMDPQAVNWLIHFTEGEKLMNSKDTSELRKAYDLFVSSARSFPDSYVARMCHRHISELLAKLNEPEQAKEEQIRTSEFYVNLNE